MTTGGDNILAAVRYSFGHRLSANTRVLVGLSGGMDSVALLHALAQLQVEMPFQLSAIHVHHGLSPNADSWATFCVTLCKSLNIDCKIVRLKLQDPTGKGIERIAREARYDAFQKADGDLLCIAHHQNDAAETLLLNLFRGAGVRGLAGMPAERNLGGKHLLRPFIDIPRSDLYAWARASNMSWIEDESNEDLRFRRNFIRRKVLPVVVEMFPAAVAVLSRTALQMGEQAELLDRLAELDAKSCRDLSGRLSVKLMQQLSEPVVRNILRHALFKAGFQIPASRRLNALASQLISARADSEIFVRMGKIGLHVWRDHVWIDVAMTKSCPASCIARADTVDWPDGELSIDLLCAQIPEIEVRPLGHGQRFQPRGRCSDTVSELMRERGVPPWVRSRLPSLWHGDELVWVAGLGWRSGESTDVLAHPIKVVWRLQPLSCL